MPSTNKTSPFQLNQYVGTDKPVWGDYTADMLKINDALRDNTDLIVVTDSTMSTSYTYADGIIEIGYPSKPQVSGRRILFKPGSDITYDYPLCLRLNAGDPDDPLYPDNPYYQLTKCIGGEPIYSLKTNVWYEFVYVYYVVGDDNDFREWVCVNLDDTGDWTPTLYGATTAGSPGYSARIGKWKKVGKRVEANFRIITSSNGGINGGLRISGLPFAASNNASEILDSVIICSGVTYTRAACGFFARVQQNAQYFIPYYTCQNSAAGAVLTFDMSHNDLASNGVNHFAGCLTYFTS